MPHISPSSLPPAPSRGGSSAQCSVAGDVVLRAQCGPACYGWCALSVTTVNSAESYSHVVLSRKPPHFSLCNTFLCKIGVIVIVSTKASFCLLVNKTEVHLDRKRLEVHTKALRKKSDTFKYISITNTINRHYWPTDSIDQPCPCRALFIIKLIIYKRLLSTFRFSDIVKS